MSQSADRRPETTDDAEYAVTGILFTILLQTNGDWVPGYLEDTVADIVAFLPRLIGALLILILGWIVGRAVAAIVERVADRTQIDRLVLDTPLGNALGGTERAVTTTLGKLAAWFVYAVAILAAADALAIELLSEWLSRVVTYLPAFVAGLLIIILGFVVADFVGDMIERTRATTETPYTSWFATGARMFLYFVVITVGLDTMGVDTEILYIFARALAWGIAAAVALGLGLGVAIALGWGGHGYVDENVGEWMGKARQRAPGSSEDSDSGSTDEDDNSSTLS